MFLPFVILSAAKDLPKGPPSHSLISVIVASIERFLALLGMTNAAHFADKF